MKLRYRRQRQHNTVADEQTIEGLDKNGRLLKGYRWENGVPVRASTWSKYYG